MTPRTSAIRSAILAAALALSVGAGRAGAQLAGESSLLLVPTARVAPAGMPTYVVGALAGGGSSLRVPIGLTFSVGAGIEVGARLDDVDSRPGAGAGGALRFAAKWAMLRSRDSVWSIAVAGAHTRWTGDDSTITPRTTTGLRVTREGYGAAWSGFVEYGTQGHLEGGLAVEHALAAGSALGVEAWAERGGGRRGLAWVRRAVAPGISAWVGLGVGGSGGRNKPLAVLVFSVAPSRVYLVRRERPVARADASADSVAGPAASAVPDLATVLAAEVAREAGVRDREELLRAQTVVVRPLQTRAVASARDVETEWLADTTIGLAESPALARDVARVIAAGCERWIVEGQADAERLTVARRLLALAGVDPSRVEVRGGGSAGQVEEARGDPEGTCRLR